MAARHTLLLFVDANIWLDFYRARNEAALSLLRHLERVADRIIVTYQLEMEFKKNRQHAMLEGMQELKAPSTISRPALFSDAKAARAAETAAKATERHVSKLKERMVRAVEKPTVHDPVFKVCQRIFHRGDDDIVLSRENKQRHVILRKAFRRFLLGYPPRKKSDTSIGDSFNWEWMVSCATSQKAGLVIVSRDGDYGLTIEKRSILNDHLRQEFRERVSHKREVHLFARLSDALKLFQVHVTRAEEREEALLISVAQPPTPPSLDLDWRLHWGAALEALIKDADTPRRPRAPFGSEGNPVSDLDALEAGTNEGQ